MIPSIGSRYIAQLLHRMGGDKKYKVVCKAAKTATNPTLKLFFIDYHGIEGKMCVIFYTALIKLVLEANVFQSAQ